MSVTKEADGLERILRGRQVHAAGSRSSFLKRGGPARHSEHGGADLGVAPGLWVCLPTSDHGDHLLPDVANVEESVSVVLTEGAEAKSAQLGGWETLRDR